MKGGKWVVLFLASIADVLTTIIATSNGAIEGNPIARYFFQNFGMIESMIGLKLAVFLVLFNFRNKKMNTNVIYITSVIFVVASLINITHF